MNVYDVVFQRKLVITECQFMRKLTFKGYIECHSGTQTTNGFHLSIVNSLQTQTKTNQVDQNMVNLCSFISVHFSESQKRQN